MGFVRQAWRGWKSYKDPEMDNRIWWLEATADFLAMGVGMRLGQPLGPAASIMGGFFAPDLIKAGALWYSTPFLQLSTTPVAAEAKRVHRILEQRRQQRLAMATTNPSQGPIFSSPGHSLLRCPPGYHLDDGACILIDED